MITSSQATVVAVTAANIFFPCNLGCAFVIAPPTRYARPFSVVPAVGIPFFPSGSRRSELTMLFLNIVDSNDPFEILGLSVSPDLDKKEIKRAYKRMAVKYHPDVVTNQSSTAEEKRKAGDIFAKINWAYATLSGKNQNDKSGGYSASASKTQSTPGGSTGYTPPHRRASSYKAPNSSTDWRDYMGDYMPKYDESDYDTGGDSLGSIFSDLISGVAGAAASGGIGGASIFRDFIEFLEGNDMAGGNDDANLYNLLQMGSFEDISNEMDDTDLVVQQLSSKLSNVEDELIMRKADLKATTRYIEKLDFEEKVDELEARKKVVQGYLKKARKRLLALQTKYKELIVSRENDIQAQGRSSKTSSHDGSGSTSSPYSTSSSSPSRNSSTESKQGSSGGTDSEEDAWKNQGFGSNGHRGSGRRRRGPTSTQGTASTSTPRTKANAGTRPQPPHQDYSKSTTQKSTSDSQMVGNSLWEPPVPPHRRTSAPSQSQDDKRRLRELKVDDEFEKLKKELGM